MGCCVSNDDHSASGSQVGGGTARDDDGSHDYTLSKFSSRRKHRYAADGGGADDEGFDSQDDSQAHMSPREVLAMLREAFPPQGDPSGVDIVTPDENDLTELQQSLRQRQLTALQTQNSLTSSAAGGPAANLSCENAQPFVVRGAGAGDTTPPIAEESLVAHTPGEAPICTNNVATAATPERPPPLLHDAMATPQSTPGALRHQSPGTGSMGTPPAANPVVGASGTTPPPNSMRARHLLLRQRVGRWMAHHVLPPPRPINVDTGPLFENEPAAGTVDCGSSSGFDSTHGHANNSFSSPHSEAETLPHTMPAPSSDAGAGGGEASADPDGVDDLPLGATATELVVPLHGPMYFVNPGLASMPAPGHQSTPITAFMGSSTTRVNRRTSAGGPITFVGADASLNSSLRPGSAALSPMGAAAVASGSGAPAAFPSPALLRVSSMGRRRGASFNTQVSSSDGMPTSRYQLSSSNGEGSTTNTLPAMVAASPGPAQPHLLAAGSSGEFAPQEQAPAVAVTAVEGSPNEVAVPFQGFSSKHGGNGGATQGGLTASPPTNQQSLSPAVGLTLPGFSRRSSRLSEQNVADVPEQDDMLDYFAPTPLAATNSHGANAAGGIAASGSLNRPRSAVGLGTSLGSHPFAQNSPPRRSVSPLCAASTPDTSTTSPPIVQPLAASPAAIVTTSPSGSTPQLVRSSSVDHPNAVPEVDELIPGFVWSMQADGQEEPAANNSHRHDASATQSALATAAETALPDQELQTRPGSEDDEEEEEEEEEE